MGFSVMSWNVEHFKNSSKMKKVVDHVRKQNPDVLGMFEVENLDVFALLRDHLPQYDFHITDGKQSQEILVAHRRSKFDQAVFVQKREFDVGNEFLRPGALLTVRQGQVFTSMLFLHSDSGTDAPAFGNRVEMLGKVERLRKALEKQVAGSRFLFLGDLNTMGLFYEHAGRVSGDEEIVGLERFAADIGMQRLPKTLEASWIDVGKNRQSKLDHVVATTNVQFTKVGKTETGTDALVDVQGWQQLTGTARKTFVNDISDHCSLLVKAK